MTTGEEFAKELAKQLPGSLFVLNGASPLEAPPMHPEDLPFRVIRINSDDEVVARAAGIVCCHGPPCR